MNPKLLLKLVLLANFIMPLVLQFCGTEAYAQSNLGSLRGETRDGGGLLPLAKAQVWVHSIDEGGDRLVVSGADGRFTISSWRNAWTWWLHVC